MQFLRHGSMVLAVTLTSVLVSSAAPAEFRAYISIRGDDELAAYDTGTTEFVDRVVLPDTATPEEVCVHPSGRLLYVLNAVLRSFSVVDTATLKVTGTYASDGGLACVFSPDGARLYLRGGRTSGRQSVNVIDTTTHDQLGYVQFPPGGGALAIHPDGSQLYVPQQNYGTILIIDALTVVILGTIDPAGDSPTDIEVHPNGETLYASNVLSDTLSVIDIPSRSVTATIPVGDRPTDMVLHPDGETLYVGCDNELTVLDTTSNTVVDSINVGVWGVDIVPDGSAVWTTRKNYGTVSVIDTSTNSVETVLTGLYAPASRFGPFIGPMPQPAFQCAGFSAPFDKGPVTDFARGRSLALRAQLFDRHGYPVTASDVTTPPIAQVVYQSHELKTALPVKPGDPIPQQDGNQFEFADDQYWAVGLKLKYQTAPGTYSIFIESGDSEEYVIDPPCYMEFVRE